MNYNNKKFYRINCAYNNKNIREAQLHQWQEYLYSTIAGGAGGGTAFGPKGIIPGAIAGLLLPYGAKDILWAFKSNKQKVSDLAKLFKNQAEKVIPVLEGENNTTDANALRELKKVIISAAAYYVDPQNNAQSNPEILINTVNDIKTSGDITNTPVIPQQTQYQLPFQPQTQPTIPNPVQNYNTRQRIQQTPDTINPTRIVPPPSTYQNQYNDSGSYQPTDYDVTAPFNLQGSIIRHTKFIKISQALDQITKMKKPKLNETISLIQELYSKIDESIQQINELFGDAVSKAPRSQYPNILIEHRKRLYRLREAVSEIEKHIMSSKYTPKYTPRMDYTLGLIKNMIDKENTSIYNNIKNIIDNYATYITQKKLPDRLLQKQTIDAWIQNFESVINNVDDNIKRINQVIGAEQAAAASASNAAARGTGGLLRKLPSVRRLLRGGFVAGGTFALGSAWREISMLTASYGLQNLINIARQMGKYISNNDNNPITQVINAVIGKLQKIKV